MTCLFIIGNASISYDAHTSLIFAALKNNQQLKSDKADNYDADYNIDLQVNAAITRDHPQVSCEKFPQLT